VLLGIIRLAGVQNPKAESTWIQFEHRSSWYTYIIINKAYISAVVDPKEISPPVYLRPDSIAIIPYIFLIQSILIV